MLLGGGALEDFMAIFYARARLPTRNGANHQKRFLPGCHRFRQRIVRRIVGQIFFAGKEAQKRSPLQCDVVPDCSAQHWVLCLKSIEHRTLCDRGRDVEFDLRTNVREVAKMVGKNDADHRDSGSPVGSEPNRSTLPSGSSTCISSAHE